MMSAMVRGLVRLALVPLDLAGPSRPRLALRRLRLRFRTPAVRAE